MPGSPLDPRARGSNDLIRQGAHLTETAADLLENLPDHPAREGLARDPLFRRDDPPGFADQSPEDEQVSPAGKDVEGARSEVAALLGPAPTAVDELVRRCQFSSGAVMAALLELELAGRIEHLPGQRVALR